MATITFEHRLAGYVVGPIWSGAEAWKLLAYNITDEDRRFGQPGSLRDHVLAATNDGDFVSCKLADCELITLATINRGGRAYRRSHVVSLGDCPSVSDMVLADWAGPCGDGEG